jgi:hypothetical protein
LKNTDGPLPCPFGAVEFAHVVSRLKPAAAAWEQADPVNPILASMEFDLPLYAVQRLADGTWLVRSLMGDPLWPAVDIVAVVGEQTNIRRDPQSAASEAASAQVI